MHCAVDQGRAFICTKPEKFVLLFKCAGITLFLCEENLTVLIQLHSNFNGLMS